MAAIVQVVCFSVLVWPLFASIFDVCVCVCCCGCCCLYLSFSPVGFSVSGAGLVLAPGLAFRLIRGRNWDERNIFLCCQELKALLCLLLYSHCLSTALEMTSTQAVGGLCWVSFLCVRGSAAALFFVHTTTRQRSVIS